MKKNRIFIFIAIFLIIFVLPVFTPSYKAVAVSSSEKQLPASEHIIYGYPSTTDTILYRKGYVLDHDNNKKVAVWVSYHLTDKYLVKNVNRSDDFRPDPDLPKGQRAELIDYKKSGYDKGHLVPAEDMRREEKTESESFLLSNMTPQIGPKFNRGIWKELEAKVRRWVKQRKDIYVIAGPIYESQNYKTIGPNKVAVPTAFYKIIVSCNYNGKDIDAIAFILPNKPIPSKKLANYITTIDEVEKETGLDFFHDLEKQTETKLEAQKSPMW